MTSYVCYYRVSTGKQDLGIPAQKSLCRRFIKQRKGKLVQEYEEKISGADKHRPQFQMAMAHCQADKCTLLVAKLDRLSRQAYTILQLREESGVDITVADNPTLFDDPLLLSVYAGIAQKERELISQRTKDALAVLKHKGVKLGNPHGFSPQSREASVRFRRKRSDQQHASIDMQIWGLHCKGDTARQITDTLNVMGIKTPKGGRIYKTLVVRRLAAIKKKNAVCSTTRPYERMESSSLSR